MGTQENCLDGMVLLSTKSSVWIIITKAKVGCFRHQGSYKKVAEPGKAHTVGTQESRLDETVLLSTHQMFD